MVSGPQNDTLCVLHRVGDLAAKRKWNDQIPTSHSNPNWISSASVLHNVSLIISSNMSPKTEGISTNFFSLSFFSWNKDSKMNEKHRGEQGKFKEKNGWTLTKFDLDLAGKDSSKKVVRFLPEKINVEVFLKRESNLIVLNLPPWSNFQIFSNGISTMTKTFLPKWPLLSLDFLLYKLYNESAAFYWT